MQLMTIDSVINRLKSRVKWTNTLRGHSPLPILKTSCQKYSVISQDWKVNFQKGDCWNVISVCKVAQGFLEKL